MILIKTTAVPQALLDLEEHIKISVRNDRKERGDSYAIVERVNDAFATLHECIDTHPVLVEEPDHIVSIQVQTTRLTGAGVECVSYKEQHNLPTHWSLYKRQANGQAVWVMDLALKGLSHERYSEAMLEAAKLSMIYKAFIEEPF